MLQQLCKARSDFGVPEGQCGFRNAIRLERISECHKAKADFGVCERMDAPKAGIIINRIT